MIHEFFFQPQNLGLLRDIITHLPTGFFVCDLECKVIYINEVYAGYFNKNPEEIIGKPITDFMPDAKISDVIKTQKPIYGATRQIKSGTNIINIVVNRTPLFDEDGNIYGAMSMALADTPEQIHNLILQMDRFKVPEKTHAKKGKKSSHISQNDNENQSMFCAMYGIEDIVGKGTSISTVKNYLKKYAKADAAVLILGQTGTGKELSASAIHKESLRAQGPYVALNCSAFPKDLFESELFGYVEGAFSGANREGKQGLMRLAHNGTLFLDEIGELPLDLQAKFLRILETKHVRPIGSEKEVEANFRLVAATNRNIKEMVEEGTFREDLYYRINPLTLQLPPLSDRQEDIPLIVDSILSDISDYPIYYSKEVLEIFKKWPWPGNIRELRNILIRAMSLCQNFTIETHDLPAEMLVPCDFDEDGNLSKTLKSSETKAILEAIESHAWNVQKTARFLGISRANLYEKMNKLQIKRPHK